MLRLLASILLAALLLLPAQNETVRGKASSGGGTPSRTACGFAPEELTAALALPFLPGKGENQGGPSGPFFCRYEQAGGGPHSLEVVRFFGTGASAATRDGVERSLAGKLEAIPGDPDHAKWQTGALRSLGVILHYYRGNTMTEVRLRGVNVSNATAVSSARARMLKLKRLGD